MELNTGIVTRIDLGPGTQAYHDSFKLKNFFGKEAVVAGSATEDGLTQSHGVSILNGTTTEKAIKAVEELDLDRNSVSLHVQGTVRLGDFLGARIS